MQPLWTKLTDKEVFGSPCPDFNEDCVQCLHWKLVEYCRSLEADSEAQLKLIRILSDKISSLTLHP